MKKLSDCHLYTLNDIMHLQKVKTVMCMKIQLFNYFFVYLRLNSIL